MNMYEKYGLSPCGAIPNKRQIEWYKRSATAFFHFGINTYRDLEWGDGTASPSQFNPSSLDCRQWIKVIKNAGFTTAIITAKHHDGFCLWPTKYSDYSIKNSPYKNGNGDLVKEFTDACHEFGIKPGIYLSPWDRNSKAWGTEEYNDYYANTLTELMTNYGKIYECWWDGAGAKGSSCDWKRWSDIVRSLQPDCVIFGAYSAAPFVDVRWVGNEIGVAGDPCWATIDENAILIEDTTVLNSGAADGERFIPAEACVSIRPGWFYHEEQDEFVKTPDKLLKYWFESAGRNSGILLNLPPDKSGLIYKKDADSLLECANILKAAFAVNLAVGSTVTASSVHDNCFPEKMLYDGDDMFYAAQKGDTTPTIEFDFGCNKTFNCFVISEVIELGHRVREYTIEAFSNGKWIEICKKECIGFRWAYYFDNITASKVKINIKKAVDSPVIKSFGIYRFPPGAFEPKNSEKKIRNLLELKSATTAVENNEFIINLGGIYDYNTLIFNGEGIKKYEIYKFNGFEYVKIYDGINPLKEQKCKFETVKISYGLKFKIIEGSSENPNIRIYCE